MSLAECLERSVNLNWKYAFVILQINSLAWAEVSRTPEQTGGKGKGLLLEFLLVIAPCLGSA